MTQNQIAYIEAMTRKQQGERQLSENERHNKAVESETYRANIATQTEIGRHNLASEGIDRGKLGVESGKLLETQRHNQINERIETAKQVETGRHNIATEGLSTAELAEKQRSNRVQEAETHRSNIAKETETSRHNTVSEITEHRWKEVAAKQNQLSVDAELKNARSREREVDIKQAEADLKAAGIGADLFEAFLQLFAKTKLK